MFILSKIGFRRILVIFLVQVTLFFGLAFGSGNSDRALATVLNPVEVEKPVDDATYKDLKAKRREAQAERSELASQDNNDENLQEKLNLEEPVPDSTKTFFKQIKGEEPIIDKTEPEN
jgi:hypothetical protein